MISRKKVREEIARLEKSIELNERKLNRMPGGTLQCHHDRGHWHWYVVEKKKDEKGAMHRHRTYLSKSENKTAEALARKGVLERQLKDDRQELKALKMYMNNCSNYNRVDNYLDKSDEIRNLTSKLFADKWSVEIQNWLDEPTTEEPYMPDKLVYRCRNGIMVRSKSEQLIGGALFYHKIPYKYECPIKFNDVTLRPDFTIMNPRTGEICIWEHFGLMSDAAYVSKCLKKIGEYINNGYIPFENLILTFESRNGGVDEVWIDRIIENYFQ